MEVSSETSSHCGIRSKLLCALACLALSATCLLPQVVFAEDAAKPAESVERRDAAAVSTEDGTKPAAEAEPREPRHRRGASLEDQVKTLSKALNLDRVQQSELRKVLMDQREQIRNVWADTAVPAPHRVAATHAISDKTADRIRAILNDEQKKKYNPPKPHEPPPTPARSVEEWMDATKSKSK